MYFLGVPVAPDPERAIELYRDLASRYDRMIGIRLVAPVPRRAVRWLALRPGQTVLDIACGTGLNPAALRSGVGTEGKVVGVDLSQEMIEVARRRVHAAGWDNVELINDVVQDAALPPSADAALFSLAHDVLQAHDAIQHVLASLRRDAVMVAAGAMEPWLPAPISKQIAALGARRYSTTPQALARPWAVLAKAAQIQRVQRLAAYAGAMYLLRANSRSTSVPPEPSQSATNSLRT
jgi:SAM-dependent methyltransferase